jgi:hypothetical protein
VTIGNYLDVSSGNTTGGGDLSSVERAPIHADGTIGTFVDASVGMVYARSSAAAMVVGTTSTSWAFVR